MIELSRQARLIFTKVLVDDAPGADIEVAHLRIAHLAVGQTDVLAVGAQLRMGIFFGHGRDIAGWTVEMTSAFVVAAVAPAVENHHRTLFAIVVIS